MKPPVAAAVVVITGTRSPMWMRAFSLFFTRMRGLASRLVRPSVCLSENRNSGSVKVRRTRFWLRERNSGRVRVPGVPAAPAAVAPPTRLTAAEPGKRMPSSISRFGISVKKALGGAVQRNRIRRRIREILRRNRTEIPSGWDIVIHPRRSVAQAPFAPLEAELVRLLRSISPRV